jgi:hypothetical protein
MIGSRRSDQTPRAQDRADDTTILGRISIGLTEIGSQLDAADRMPGHSPWSAIADQEAEIRRLAPGLSDRFSTAHPDLATCLRSCHNLHTLWGKLQDEVEAAISRTSPTGW